MNTEFTAEDKELLAELAVLLRRCDPVPPRVLADAEAAFALAAVPDDWKVLERLSDVAMVRSGGVSFRFGDKDFTVELELRRLPWRLQLIGMITPAAELEVGGRRIRPDASGFFRVDDLPRGPLRVVVLAEQTRVTRWFWP
jgi:hypothetical protein